MNVLIYLDKQVFVELIVAKLKDLFYKWDVSNWLFLIIPELIPEILFEHQILQTMAGETKTTIQPLGSTKVPPDCNVCLLCLLEKHQSSGCGSNETDADILCPFPHESVAMQYSCFSIITKSSIEFSIFNQCVPLYCIHRG